MRQQQRVLLSVTSGYRTADSCTLTQGTCAKGVSNHQRGLAVDFNGFKSASDGAPNHQHIING